MQILSLFDVVLIAPKPLICLPVPGFAPTRKLSPSIGSILITRAPSSPRIVHA